MTCIPIRGMPMRCMSVRYTPMRWVMISGWVFGQKSVYPAVFAERRPAKPALDGLDSPYVLPLLQRSGTVAQAFTALWTPFKLVTCVNHQCQTHLEDSCLQLLCADRIVSVRAPLPIVSPFLPGDYSLLLTISEVRSTLPSMQISRDCFALQSPASHSTKGLAAQKDTLPWAWTNLPSLTNGKRQVHSLGDPSFLERPLFAKAATPVLKMKKDLLG